MVAVTDELRSVFLFGTTSPVAFKGPSFDSARFSGSYLCKKQEFKRLLYLMLKAIQKWSDYYSPIIVLY